MKKNHLLRCSVQHIVIFIFLPFALFCLASCASKMAFKTSTIVPAAEGYVKVKKDANKNYKIDLNIKRLVDPERLRPSRDTYVVWMETGRNTARNIGQLTTSSGLFSKKLKSSLETVSPIEPKGFFITAENDGQVQYPGSMVVLRTDD